MKPSATPLHLTVKHKGTGTVHFTAGFSKTWCGLVPQRDTHTYGRGIENVEVTCKRCQVAMGTIMRVGS